MPSTATSTMQAREIAEATGMTIAQIQKKMRQRRIEHDGSAQKNYPVVPAMKLISSHRSNNRRTTSRRHSIVAPVEDHVAVQTSASPCTLGAPEVKIFNRSRTVNDISVAFRVGPTNSGKTFTALENLFSAFEADPTGRYVYAGPLRMLAFEVYGKMVERFGAENVGFLTGDAQINPEAALIACTVEMTPESGQMIVLDEAHWCIQQSRGDRWTHLMTQGSFQHFEVICSAEAVEIIEPLFQNVTDLQVHRYERRTPLVYGGAISLDDIPPSSAVVCFSRKRVFQMAEMLRLKGHQPGVLYGALPLETRKDQVRRFLSGEYDVMVVTDVIGHGVNLPIDNVIFAETVKFDGISRRKLLTWEGGQIAGRAGRFGLSERGTVYLATGASMFSKDADSVRRFVDVASGATASDLPVIKPAVAPLYEELALSLHRGACVSEALMCWEERALQDENLRDVFTPMVPLDVQRSLLALRYTGPDKQEGAAAVELPRLLWNLTSLPLRPDGKVLPAVHNALITGSGLALRKLIDDEVVPALGTTSLVNVENAALTLGELQMAYLAFPEQCGFLDGYDLIPLRDRLVRKMSKELHRFLIGK